MDAQGLIYLGVLALSNIIIVWRLCRTIEKTQTIGGESREVLVKKLELKGKEAKGHRIQTQEVFS